jgi:hypothetical protein
MLFTHLYLGLPSGHLPSGFPTSNIYTFVLSPIRASCPTQLIFLDFILLIILGEEYKSRSSSLCSILHPPITVARDELFKTGCSFAFCCLPVSYVAVFSCSLPSHNLCPVSFFPAPPHTCSSLLRPRRLLLTPFFFPTCTSSFS